MFVLNRSIVARGPTGVHQHRSRRFKWPISDHAIEFERPRLAMAPRNRDDTEPRQRDDNHGMEDWIFYQNGDPAAWPDASTNNPPTNIVHAPLQARIADKIELRARRTKRKFRRLVSALRENWLDDVHFQHQWTLNTRYRHQCCYSGIWFARKMSGAPFVRDLIAHH